jgi:hypothetical protein
MRSVRGSSSVLASWTGGCNGRDNSFARISVGPLPATAEQLFAIPASDAEDERTIKIIRAVLGKHSCQMSNATLIARV